MNISKDITVELARIRDKMVAGCKVKSCDPSNGELYSSRERDYSLPCPTCAPMRVLDLCWHETIPCAYVGIGKSKQGRFLYWPTAYTNFCSNCRRVANEFQYPDYTTPQGWHELISHLRVLGLWEKFKVHIWNAQLEYAPRLIGKLTKHITKFADILTTPELGAQAVLSFLKGVE